MDQKWLPDEILNGVRVVLVEANSEDRAVLTALLSMYGADVRAGSCAREAIGLLQSAGPPVLACGPGAATEGGPGPLRQARASSAECGPRPRFVRFTRRYCARA